MSFYCSYIIDVYLFAAASALAGNTVCRSAFGTGCVLPSPSFLHQSLTTDIGDVLSPSVSPCSLRRCLRCVPGRSLVVTTCLRKTTDPTSHLHQNLNPRIASTVLGAIAVAFVSPSSPHTSHLSRGLALIASFIVRCQMPVPFLFIKFGPALRARSRYSPHAKKK